MLRVEGLQKKVLCPDHSEQLIAELPELSLPTGSSRNRRRNHLH